MPGFRNISEVADAHDAGRVITCSLRKLPTVVTSADYWVDLSMSPGNPLPNYYASEPLVAATLSSWRGLVHGDAKSPATKHLASLSLMTPTAAMLGQYTLLDYVLYYPFVDGDSLDVQPFDNTVVLPRYATGEGVRVMAVVVAPVTGNGTMTYTYINQDGVQKVSPNIDLPNAAFAAGNIVTSLSSARGGYPFLPLAAGDTGVRRIVSVQNTVANGGLLSLVLVRPLADIVLHEINTANEINLLRQRPILPTVYDGAYLNLITRVSGGISGGILAGSATFVWST